MKKSVVIELERKTDEVVTIPRYQTALFQSSALELLEIRKSFGLDLMNTKGIHSSAAEQFRNPLAQIFIDVIPQERSWTNDG